MKTSLKTPFNTETISYKNGFTPGERTPCFLFSLEFQSREVVTVSIL